MEHTVEELKKSIERIKKYTALIPLVEKEQQSQFLHNIYVEAEGIEEVLEEVIK